MEMVCFVLFLFVKSWVLFFAVYDAVGWVLVSTIQIVSFTSQCQKKMRNE